MVTRLAVLGSPIAHSKSPLLHRAAYRVLGLDWQYGRDEVAEDGIGAFISGRDATWRGLSLTMPLKQAVIPLLDDLDLVARSTGAVNTVLFDEPLLDAPLLDSAATSGRTSSLRSETDARSRVLRGFNTDVAGIVRALANDGITRADHVEVLGGGATAASAVAAAAALGAELVTVTVRSPHRAANLADVARASGSVAHIRSFAEAGSDSGRTSGSTPALVISTLPNGTVLDDPIPAATRAESVLFDVAYDPWPSALAVSWQDAGGRVLPGIAMLVEQALVQVRIFVTGDPTRELDREADVLEAMRAAVSES